ncbi:Copper chaperone domain-containing protein [Dioscorea alata]|uniref:Copper chaperone domain-containing protein n=1 Tax=Dioscorea alata TaxID=55571 RepID=A0ACB7UEM1_DIOAL|nr:Copper chaperone domain-containing protein [Dioscorea alata]
MVKRIVLKVDVSCQKCKRKLMQAISRSQGVDKIEIDVIKSTVTVTGDADPIEVIMRTRKAGKFAEIISIGPPPPPPKQTVEPVKKTEDKKVDDKKKTEEKKPTNTTTKEKKPEVPLLPSPLPLPPPLPAIVIHTQSTCPMCQHVGVHDPQPSCVVM